jgi:hypothetical protein
MAPETFLRGASLLQLTEALISKSDQVFVRSFLTAKTHVTFWRSFVFSGSPPTGRVPQSFEGCGFSYRRRRAPRVTAHRSTCTPLSICRPLFVTLIRTTGTQTLDLVLRVDGYPLDCNFPNLLSDQRKATHFAAAARDAYGSFRLVPTPRIGGTIQMVHMGTAHVRLARVEIDDSLVPYSLVGGMPQQQNLSGNHSDVVAEVRRTFFGCYRPIGNTSDPHRSSIDTPTCWTFRRICPGYESSSSTETTVETT